MGHEYRCLAALVNNDGDDDSGGGDGGGGDGDSGGGDATVKLT